MQRTWRTLATGALSLLTFAAIAAPVSASAPPPTDPPTGDSADPAAQTGAEADPTGRAWPVPIGVGCTPPRLADVVFVGTVVDTDFQTARYRIDQVRVGDLARFAVGGRVDVRYGDDTRFLAEGDQYLIGASESGSTGLLASKVRSVEPLFAGNDVIGVTEKDVSCPKLDDPVRTLQTDGTGVDTGLLGPLAGAKGDVLRAIMLPLAIAVAAVFALAAVRWILTGVGKGVGSVVATATQTREVRAARRKEA